MVSAVNVLLLLSAGASGASVRQPSPFELPANLPRLNASAPNAERYILVGAGNYQSSNTTEVHVFIASPTAGVQGPLRSTRVGTNPSWICGGGRKGEPKGPLYACLESVSQKTEGGMAGTSFDANEGKLSLVNTAPWPAGGNHGGPAHCAVAPLSRPGETSYVVAANYGLGQTAVFPADAAGKLSPSHQMLQYDDGSHAHCVAFSPDGRFVFVVDLGLDVVHGYRWNSASGKLEPGNTLVLEAGTDPRHLTFSADGKWGLLQTEKTSMLMALAYDSDEGRFAQPTPARTTSTIPGDWNGISYGAEVRAHPNGKVVYVSNRGHDSVAVVNFDPTTGGLRVSSWQQELISWPRGMDLSPEGDVLVVANQQGSHGSTIVGFAVSESGTALKLAGKPMEVEEPTDVVFPTE